MLDTLKLHIKEFEVEDTASIRVKGSTQDIGTGEVFHHFPLFQSATGKKYYGAKAFINTPHYNLTIKPIPRRKAEERDGSACFLQLSVPKVYHGNNYYSVGEQGTQAVLQQVEKELSEEGFHTSLLESDISRIDTAQNITTEEPFSSYYSLFSMLKARRAVKRGYGTTWLVHNTQQEFCVYDKLEEMKMHEIEVENAPSNVMRFEHRLLNKAKVKNTYGFSQVSELFKGGYQQVKEHQKEAWNNALFSHSPEDIIQLGSAELQQVMSVFKEKHNRFWFDKFLKAYGAYYLAEYAGEDVITLALQNFEVDRMKVWRMKKVMEEARREIEFIKKEEYSDKTLGTLFTELKDKLIA